jgi:hypothetical protein
MPCSINEVHKPDSRLQKTKVGDLRKMTRIVEEKLVLLDRTHFAVNKSYFKVLVEVSSIANRTHTPLLENVQGVEVRYICLWLVDCLLTCADDVWGLI